MINELNKILKENIDKTIAPLNENKQEKDPFLMCDNSVSKTCSAIQELIERMKILNTGKSIECVKTLQEMYNEISTYTPSNKVFEVKKLGEESEIQIGADVPQKNAKDIIKMADSEGKDVQFVKEGYVLVKEAKISNIEDLTSIL